MAIAMLGLLISLCGMIFQIPFKPLGHYVVGVNVFSFVTAISIVTIRDYLSSRTKKKLNNCKNEDIK